MKKSKFVNEFREFISRGNVLDMAIGIIIGIAFGKIVSSLVNDIIMPPLGKLLGNIDFTHLYVTLNGLKYQSLEAAKEAGAPVLAYGNFIQTVVDFIIIALIVFLMVKGMNKIKKKQQAEAAPSAAPPRTDELLEEIRDILKK